jgi:hypothetical protein
MGEEGIVGEYFEVGKYGIGRFVMYNIVFQIIFKGCLSQKTFQRRQPIQIHKYIPRIKGLPCMREEGIVGEYVEVGKYEIGRFVLYNIVFKIIFKGYLLQKTF